MATKIGHIEFENVREVIGKKGISYEYNIIYYDELNVKRRKFCTYRPPAGLTGKDLAEALQTEIKNTTNKLNGGTTEKAQKFGVVAHEWLTIEAKQKHEVSTYEVEIKRLARICKVFGESYIDKITSRNLQKYFVSLAEDEGLSSAYIKSIRTCIKSVFAYAKNHGMIDENPVKNTEVPKQRHKEQKQSKNHDIFSEDEMIIFDELLNNPEIRIYWRCFFKILLETGARKSEILALERRDIKGNVIHFDRSAVQKGKEVVINPRMKTKNSHRYNTVTDEVITLIHELFDYQDNRAERLGELWSNPNNRLFTYWNGRQMGLNEPNAWLNNFLAKHENKLHRVTIHSFRHLFVSGLIDSQKYTVPQIAKMIGDTPNTVTVTYEHFFKRAEARTHIEAPALCLPIHAKKQAKKAENVGNPVGKIIYIKNQNQQTPIKSALAVGD